MMSSKYLSMCWVSRIKTTTRKVSIKGPMKEESISLSSFFMKIKLLIRQKLSQNEFEIVFTQNRCMKNFSHRQFCEVLLRDHPTNLVTHASRENQSNL